MFGGHLDSWASGTGATDNGAGVAMAMEVMRIFNTLQVKTRRTIRVGLWTGEEAKRVWFCWVCEATFRVRPAVNFPRPLKVA